MRLAFDLEANGLYPDKIWCIVTYDLDRKEYGQWTCEDGLDLYLWLDAEFGNVHEITGHNIINYDLPVLERLTGWTPPPSCRVTDTLVCSRLLSPDREGGHSLRAWGDRLGFPKGDHAEFSTYSSDMLEYCRRDVDVTVQVYRQVAEPGRGEQEGHDWSMSLALEHRIARIITEQEINGFYFDTSYASRILGSIVDRIRGIEYDCQFPDYHGIRQGSEVPLPYKMDGTLRKLVLDYFGDLLGDPDRYAIEGPFCKLEIERFNPDSTHHMKDWLLSIGWKPDKHTPTGAPQLTYSSLKKMGRVGELIIERGILSHRKRQIEGLIDRVRSDRRIGAGANPCGTPTGRMRHSNVVNIPKADPSVVFGKEIRSLFCVPQGRILVGYDARGLELRDLAHYIGNPKYTEVIVNGDPHVFAQRAAGLPDRQSGKTFIYAFIYGAGFGKLGSLVGGGYNEGKRVAERMYEAVPGLGSLVERVRRAAKRGYLIGLDGRKLWLRDEHKALNTLIQSAGAVCMKQIAVILDDKVDKSKAMKVCDMHDEAQWEVDPDYVETFSELVHQSFVECTQHFNLNCPLEADVKTGRNWAETH